MELEKKYKIGADVETAMSGTLSWDSYIQAEECKDKINGDVGLDLKVYKVVTTVTEADRVSEDYWEYR